MPTLEWIGKEKVINHHQDVPFRVLERKYSYDENGQHDEDNGSENMIIRGDNLEALKALLPKYEGRVKYIYIDPPYNTGNEGWVYNDNVNDPKIKKWLGEVVGKEGEDLSRHDKWLCMMYPRLKLLHKLLSDDGAIFISIDDNEYTNLKFICDEIFGSNCFVSNISWQRTYSARNDSKGIVNEVEHLLVYSKKPAWNPKKLARTAEMDERCRSNELTQKQKLEVVRQVEELTENGYDIRVDLSGGELFTDIPAHTELLAAFSAMLGQEKVGVSCSGYGIDAKLAEFLASTVHDVEMTMDVVPYRPYKLRPMAYGHAAAKAVPLLKEAGCKVGLQTVASTYNNSCRDALAVFAWACANNVDNWSMPV